MNCANHLDRERVAFCQNCGKPLCQECTRVVGSAVFCEPCLAARLAGVPLNASGYSSSYDSTAANANANYIVDSIVPPPRIPGAPSPALATILGFIPGVGAMYNGQYAKGIVHLIVFAILVSLASDVNGIFGLFIAGWVVYQAIEANHTARAKLAGTPLPNPFGLNDLGERFGFGKAWVVPGATDAAAAADVPFTPPASGYQPYTPPATPTPAAGNWGAPAENYNYSAPPISPIPPMPPYGTGFNPGDPNSDFNPNPVVRNRFPVGAIWLIGLGIFFLIGNSNIFHGFPFHRIFPLFLIALGVWLFIRKMTETGSSLSDDGTAMYRIRLFRALRGSVWVILVGVVFFLATFDILSWGHSWPLFIIVAGLMTLLERAAYANAPAGYPYATGPSGPSNSAAEPASTPAATTAIVPSNHTHDQEGN
jgi:TM2 domain-containing membrane protein YozV